MSHNCLIEHKEKINTDIMVLIYGRFIYFWSCFIIQTPLINICVFNWSISIKNLELLIEITVCQILKCILNKSTSNINDNLIFVLDVQMRCYSIFHNSYAKINIFFCMLLQQDIVFKVWYKFYDFFIIIRISYQGRHIV